MLKKIGVPQVRVGMYIERVCGSWMESPFWQKSLLLTDDAELKKLQTSRIREVWIDLGKGADVEDEEELPDEAPAAPAPPVSAPVRLADIAPVPMAQELVVAAKVLRKSREAVHSMFGEVRMGKAVTVEDALPLVEEITTSVMRNAGAMLGLVRLKNADDYTYMHSVAVCALMIALGRQLELDDAQIREAGLAGLLHDIGKMAIPLWILNKPGKLSDEEFHTVKGHPAAGHKMLAANTDICAMALDVCLHHHEKMDGSGYPERLKGDGISLYARMGAVCDVYDAITSNRPYKQGWCPAESLRRMAEWRDHFDPVVFAAFVKCIGIYPIGTLVRLKSGLVGVVVEQPVGKSLVRPKVRVFFSARSQTYVTPQLIDLATPAAAHDEIATREDAAKWGLQDINRYWAGTSTWAGAAA
ncbi:MAG: HD-GYP domain-containing protein [Pseudomonadota bacterium]